MEYLDSALKILFSLIAIWLGSTGINEFLKGRNENIRSRREDRRKLIEDALKLARHLDSANYPSLGDFRQDIRFISIEKYFSKDFKEKVEFFIPANSIPDGTSEDQLLKQVQLYDEIVHGFKNEIVKLESEWLSNSKFGFFRK